MLRKEMAEVDWTRPAKEIHDQIRGLNPWPLAVSQLDGHRLKLLASRVREGKGEPGKAFSQNGSLLVHCGEALWRSPCCRPTRASAWTGKVICWAIPWGRAPGLE